MAITAYVGLPGAGKSYEMVRSVIIPAMKTGRRIVTNVYGVDNEKIRAYILKDKKLNPDDLGELIFVKNEQVLQPDFFPVPGVENPVALAGDLIILDECHRFFPSEKAVPHNIKTFAAEHRHYVNEYGHTCDLVLVSQSLNSVARFIKDRVETTYKMTKLIALGLDKRYRVDVYEGAICRKNNLINTYQEKYKSEIYSLYHSYDGVNAEEKRVDSRARVFKKSTVFYFLVFLCFVVWAIFTYVVPIFSGDAFGVKKTDTVPAGSGNAPVYSVSPAPAPAPASAATVPESMHWCVAGFYSDSEDNYILLRGMDSKLRMVSRRGFKGEGIMISGVVDGVSVNAYSCTSTSWGEE